MPARAIRAGTPSISDEMDRCRPDFAVALLERIKHLFAVEGVVFVLALDKEQLAHTVRAIYGQGFAAEGYLRRFIDYDYRLPASTGKTFAEFLAEKHSLVDVYKNNRVSHSEYEFAAGHFATLAAIYHLSLRDQEQAFQRIVLALKAAPTGQYLYTNLMVFLGVLRWGNPDLYHRYMSGSATVAEVIADVRGRRGGAEYLRKRGHTTQGYLIVSARRESKGAEYYEELKRVAKSPDVSEDERYEASHVVRSCEYLPTVKGDHALKAAIARLEKINEQLDTSIEW